MKRFRKKIAYALVVSLLCFLFPLTSLAADIPENTKLEGIALKDPTNMYEAPSLDSNVLRTFESGKILKYYYHSKDWYRSSVQVNGVTKTIYIHASDVENITSNPVLLSGIAVNKVANMYESPSKNSKVLRSFPSGKELKYYTFTSEWYRSSVTVNGKATTIYIHKSDVEHIVEQPVLLSGVSLKEPTNLYASASKEAQVLRTFNSGKVLKYYTYTSEWYRSSVLVNGKNTTIYIHKNDVDNLVEKKELKEGIAIKNPTNMYSMPAKNSKVLRTFSEGHILKFYTYSNNWYESSTTVNGQNTTIYIHRDDVELATPSNEKLEGIAKSNPTNIYASASTHSSILKSYSSGAFLKFYDYSKNWYKTSVWVDGKGYMTGYINKSNVSLDNIIVEKVHYNIDFNEFLKIQSNVSPKVDGSGQFIASQALVEYFSNPNNFKENSKEYFQFLDLSSPANLDINEANEKILKGKGALENQAAHFIEAAKLYNVNEVYLLSHALHETGNGTSPLAKGVPVDDKGNVVAPEKAKYTVYNMYGYGAYDGSALQSGAKYAFNQKWFSKREAIIGGAKVIASSYINDGQNTLYKMRWNPDNPGKGQYATHVEWATSQTSRIQNIYSMISNYVLKFEIPTFNNQPNAISKPVGDAQYAVLPVVDGLVGKVTDNLKLREYPVSGNVITVLPINSEISIIGQNGGWYKVKVNGQTGWVSGDYVTFDNALQVVNVTTTLNVRSQPNTTNSQIIGSLKNLEIVIGFKDSNGKFEKDSTGKWYKIQFNNGIGWVSADYIKEL